MTRDVTITIVVQVDCEDDGSFDGNIEDQAWFNVWDQSNASNPPEGTKFQIGEPKPYED